MSYCHTILLYKRQLLLWHSVTRGKLFLFRPLNSLSDPIHYVLGTMTTRKLFQFGKMNKLAYRCCQDNATKIALESVSGSCEVKDKCREQLTLVWNICHFHSSIFCFSILVVFIAVLKQATGFVTTAE